MTTQEAAMRKALEALKLARSSHGMYLMSDPPQDAWKVHRVDSTIVEAIESLRTALAQQGEQQPVCAGCGIPEGDVHISTCQSGKWPLRVSNGDTATPAPQPLTDKEQIALNKRELFARMEAPVAWVWNPASIEWEKVRSFGHWQQGALYAFGPTQPGPIAAPAPQPAQSNQVLIDALKLCYEHCRVYHPEVETNNVGQAVRAALQSAQPVAWTHSCNALCTDGLELWCDHCPHCGKPRTTHAEQWPPGLITDIVLTVTALHKEVDIGWSPDARSHLSRLSTSIGMLATTHPAPQPAHEGGKPQLPPFQPCTAGAMCLDCQPRGASDECPDATAWTDGKGYATTSKTIAEHHAADGEQMMELVARGCAYCNHPMYLGRACKNCGRDVAPPVVKTCETCAHLKQGKLPGVSIHDETCYECSEYYANKWEAENE